MSEHRLSTQLCFYEAAEQIHFIYIYTNYIKGIVTNWINHHRCVETKKSNMNNFYTIVIVLIACQHINSSIATIESEEHERNKRSIFLKGSGIGVSFEQFSCQKNKILSFSSEIFSFAIILCFQYLVALAIPTSAVNRQRVYMAFNFEAHYGLASGDTLLSSLRMPVIQSIFV